MKAWRPAFLALRILSIWLFLRALVLAAEAAELLARGSSQRWPIVIGIASLVAVAAFIWIRSDAIADRVALAADEQYPRLEGEPEQTDGPMVLSVPSPELLRIAVIVAGIVVAADAVPALIANVGQAIVSAKPFYSEGDYLRKLNIVGIVASVGRLAVGLFLALRARAILDFLDRRNRGEGAEVAP